METPTAAIAVDWSGARNGAKRVWVAEVEADQLVSFRGGWKPDDLVRWLVERSASDAAFVVGFDFVFGFPAWFARRFGETIQATWAAAETQGETWLLAADPPFWGRPGRARPSLREDEPALRRTDKAHKSKSVFQVGGAGSVGTGSIRGMPHLAKLDALGFSIWPFDPVGLPLVVEIYPRALRPRGEKRFCPAQDICRESPLAGRSGAADRSSGQ